MKFIDLFAGLGGFHAALSSLGHECVFASELDEELRQLYEQNFQGMKGRVFGDIRRSKGDVPKHDILCAGFPCQPFSKSGAQAGVKDKTRGTLFHDILEILRKHQPKYVLLENVGNFERHDNGRTWAIVKESLTKIGYHVRGTEHLTSGGHGLISPHHLGFPHTRERFFVVGSLNPIAEDPFPERKISLKTSLHTIEQSDRELTDQDVRETRLLEHYIDCVDHWNTLLRKIPPSMDLPSFPIWGDEIEAIYPYMVKTPHAHSAKQLHSILGLNGADVLPKGDLMKALPSYARAPTSKFPVWKIDFIRQNRNWFRKIDKCMTQAWISSLRKFPPSLRKLEWNCKGETRDLWKHVLQFRPSGLRAKRYAASPALVAMTTTQIPILGPKRRHITRIEGLRLQGFEDSHCLPRAHQHAFRALGNAVHAGVVRAIAKQSFK